MGRYVRPMVLSKAIRSTPCKIRGGRKAAQAHHATSLPSLRPRVDRDVVALRRTDVELARTPDLPTWILNHFLPLRDPTGGTRHREKHGEHGHREAHRFQRDPGIEIDIRIELLLDEILVAEGDFL